MGMDKKMEELRELVKGAEAEVQEAKKSRPELRNKLLPLIKEHPDWGTGELVKALKGEVTATQVSQWKYQHRAEICALFGGGGSKDQQKQCSTRAIDQANAVVKKLTSQTDEERQEGLDEISAEGSHAGALRKYREKAEELAGLKEQYRTLEEENGKLKQEAELLRQRMKAMSDTMEAMNAEANRIRGDYEHIAEIRSERDGLRKRYNEIEYRVSERNRVIEELTRKNEEMRAKVEEMNAQAEVMLVKVQELEARPVNATPEETEDISDEGGKRLLAAMGYNFYRNDPGKLTEFEELKAPLRQAFIKLGEIVSRDFTEQFSEWDAGNE